MQLQGGMRSPLVQQYEKSFKKAACRKVLQVNYAMKKPNHFE